MIKTIINILIFYIMLILTNYLAELL